MVKITLVTLRHWSKSATAESIKALGMKAEPGWAGGSRLGRLDEDGAGLIQLGCIAFDDPSTAIGLLLVEELAIAGGTFREVAFPETEPGSVCGVAASGVSIAVVRPRLCGL